MKIKKFLKFAHKFIPRFIRRQFIDDIITGYRLLKPVEVEIDYIIQNFNFNIVNSITELGCEFIVFHEEKNRVTTINGAKLVIEGQEYSKDNIQCNLLDFGIYEIKDVKIIGMMDTLINQDKIFNPILKEMGVNHVMRRPDLIMRGDNGTFNIKIVSENVDCDNSKIYIHLLGEYAYNYYHWIVETLPRLQKIIDILERQTNFRPEKYTILIDSKVPSQCIEALLILTKKSYQIRKIAASETLFCKKVIYCTPISSFLDNGLNLPNILKDIIIDRFALKQLRDTLLKYLEPKPFKKFSNKKIYLQRNNNFRKIENIHAIEMLLHKKGFEFINPVALTFVEQLSIFHHADVVIGSSGATFTNILFMRPETLAINLFPSVSAINYNIFPPLADVANVNLKLFLTEPTTESESIHGNAMVDVKALECYLNEIL